MKIKKLIQILECIEGDYKGKIPLDMYDLGSYTRGDDSRVGIDDMDFVHVMRSFKKMQNILAEEERRDTQEGKVAELEQEVARLKKDNDYIDGRYDEGLQVSVTQTNQIMKLEQEVSHLRRQKADLHKLLEKRSYMQVTAPRYVFSEIPRDIYGEAFVDALKKYLNKSRYSMRVRGQHIKDEYKGTGATAHGQNIEQSTHLRVYIEEK